jgi:hypothetical protein
VPFGVTDPLPCLTVAVNVIEDFSTIDVFEADRDVVVFTATAFTVTITGAETEELKVDDPA